MFEDRTPAHADHVGFGPDRMTTAAVGMTRDEDSKLFSSDPAQQKNRKSETTLIRNERKFLYIFMKKNIFIIVTAVHQ